MLSKKEPVPPLLCKAKIASLQRFEDRNTVEDRELLNSCRVVHRGAKCRVTSTVVAGQKEPVETEMFHERDTVTSLGPL